MKVIGNNIVLFEEHGQLVVKLTDPVAQQQARAIKQASFLPSSDGILMQLPWCEDTLRVLSNIGVDATEAAPFMMSDHPLIEGKYAPMKHQLFTAAFVTLHPRCYVLNDPRTGKTGSLIIAMDYMQRARLVTGGFLIITTVTTMPGVWRDGILETIPGAHVEIVNGKGREEALRRPADFYVTNYDSVRLSTQAFMDAVKEGRIGGCVIDEMTHIGNTSSQRHKAIDAVVNKMNLKHVIGVTGSPGENPETVFGMCRMINRAKLPATTKGGWLNITTYQYGPEPYMRTMSPQAPDIIHGTMQPSVRFNKGDIIDLPPIVTQDRECSLSSEQKRMREQFKEQAIALTNSGEVITAANGGVLYQKLMQVAQGFCTDNDGVPIPLPHADRTKTIIEAISETSRKVVVFAHYKFVIQQLAKELESAGYTVGIVDGSITGQQRADVLRRFQNTPDPHVIICHPTTTAYGVELAAADTMIFNGPPPLGGFIYAQALERLSSAKQTAKKISIIRIMASPEEKKFFKTLDSGREMGTFISGLFEDFAKGAL